MSFTYPTFPTLSSSNIGSSLVQLLIWIFSIPVVAIAKVIRDITSAIGTAAGQTAGTVINFPGKIFQQTEASFTSYGVLAPIIAAAIWGISIVLLIFFVIKAAQVGLNEFTDTE